MQGEVANCVRTTAVVTGIESFPPGNNVIPSLTKAAVNLRVLPGEVSLQSVAKMCHQVLNAGT